MSKFKKCEDSSFCRYGIISKCLYLFKCWSNNCLFHSNFHPIFVTSNFSRRNRAIPLGQSPYGVVPGSIKFTDSNIDLQIINNNTNIALTLQVIILQQNTVRFKINEINPIHQRYEVQDVLVDDPVRSR